MQLIAFFLYDLRTLSQFPRVICQYRATVGRIAQQNRRSCCSGTLSGNRERLRGRLSCDSRSKYSLGKASKRPSDHAPVRSLCYFVGHHIRAYRDYRAWATVFLETVASKRLVPSLGPPSLNDDVTTTNNIQIGIKDS